MNSKKILTFGAGICSVLMLTIAVKSKANIDLRALEFKEEKEAIQVSYLESAKPSLQASTCEKILEDTFFLFKEEDTISSHFEERVEVIVINIIENIKAMTPEVIGFENRRVIDDVVESTSNEIIEEVLIDDVETQSIAMTKPEEGENVDEIMTPVTTFLDVPIEPIPENYLEVKRMLSTAYCHCQKCCNKDRNHPAYGVTYSGINLLDGEVHKVIAADLEVFPIGTKVYIEDYGIAVVGDIGGGVNGNHVDIYFPTHEEALSWKHGMQEIDVYVLSYPEE